MFGGSELIFAAIWAIGYRHKKLVMVDWLAVIITVVGITIVGVSSLITQTDDPQTSQAPVIPQIGAMFLILIGMGLSALQTVLEEELLQDVDATSCELASYERSGACPSQPSSHSRSPRFSPRAPAMASLSTLSSLPKCLDRR
jgi:drug/metabolite transporter (DMT)-like permease